MAFWRRPSQKCAAPGMAHAATSKTAIIPGSAEARVVATLVDLVVIKSQSALSSQLSTISSKLAAGSWKLMAVSFRS
jgi:hypothetical protein